jgi:hypothetical protein
MRALWKAIGQEVVKHLLARGAEKLLKETVRARMKAKK